MWCGRVIIVSALSLRDQDRDREKEKERARETELDKTRLHHIFGCFGELPGGVTARFNSSLQSTIGYHSSLPMS